MKPMMSRFDAKASNPASKAIRSFVDISGEFLGFEHVAGAAHCVQQRPVEALLELSPKSADVNVDHVGRRIEMIIPDLLEQHRAGDDPPFVPGEIFKKQIFARLEVELLAAALHGAREGVN